MRDIADFVQSEAERPFAWGVTDCCQTADRWVARAKGISPTAAFGRIYRNEAEARAWLAEPGGLAVAINRIMRNTGFKRTDTPVAGDVGLVVHDDKLMMAVHTGSVWFSRDESGFIGAPLAAVWKAWSLGACR